MSSLVLMRWLESSPERYDAGARTAHHFRREDERLRGVVRSIAELNAAPLIRAVRVSPKGVPMPQLTIIATARSRLGSAQAPEPPNPKWPKA